MILTTLCKAECLETVDADIEIAEGFQEDLNGKGPTLPTRPGDFGNASLLRRYPVGGKATHFSLAWIIHGQRILTIVYKIAKKVRHH